MIRPSRFASILAENPPLAQPAPLGSFLERKPYSSVQTGGQVGAVAGAEASRSPPRPRTCWGLGWGTRPALGPLSSRWVHTQRCACSVCVTAPTGANSGVFLVLTWSDGPLLRGARAAFQAPPPRHVELPHSPIPPCFLPRLFYGISPGCHCPKRVYSPCPNCCRCFPRCKKPGRILSKLQNPSPGSSSPGISTTF